MPKKPDDAPLSDAEIERRMERAIRKSFTMPPQPHKTPRAQKRRTRKGKLPT